MLLQSISLIGNHAFRILLIEILNVTYHSIVDQKQYYSEYKRMYSYKYQPVITSDRLVSSFINLFIERYNN